MGTVDYLSNCFLPNRTEVWGDILSENNVRARSGSAEHGLTDGAGMVERMDALGIDTIVLPAGDVERYGPSRPDFEHAMSSWAEVEDLASRYPGRFAAMAAIDPTLGSAGVRELGARCEPPWVVGMYVHTHSWDLRLDAPEYYPYYLACSQLGLAVAMQVGISGGRMASECARPMTVNRAALYFPEVPFVLSHTGWPWTEEAIALALKLDNVYIGTGSYPPRRWPSPLVEFLRGPGWRKVVFGTNFPLVSHAIALEEVEELGFGSARRQALLGGNARRVFAGLADRSAKT